MIWSLAAGGAQRVVVSLAGHLTARGHAVSIITMKGRKEDFFVTPSQVQRLSVEGKPVLAGPFGDLLERVSRLLYLRRTVAAFKPEVIVSLVDITNILVLGMTLGLRIPVIISERIYPPSHPIGMGWQLLRRVTYPFCSRLVVQTAAVADWARGLVSSRKVEIIPNAAPAVTHREGSSRERIVLGVGRLTRQKGFDLLLRAFAASQACRLNWRLAILGEGPERGALENLAKQLGIAEYLELPGETRYPERWYQRCGIFVLSSRFEGFPNALLEAMANGAACVAYDCPSGPRDITKSGEDAVLLPPEDIDELADAISKLSKDEPLRSELGRKAVSVSDRFSIQAVSGLWEALIAEVTRRRTIDSQ